MSKQLYEEALADVKKVTQVAEDNAKRAILEVVTPRIRQLIERELLNEGFGDDEEEEIVVNDEVGLPVAVDVGASPADAITPPDAEGKVTLDLDALGGDCTGEPVEAPMFGEPHLGGEGEEEYMLGLESLEALKPVINASANTKKLQRSMSAVVETIKNLRSANKALVESVGFDKQIARTISQVEDMYEYVQERISESSKKKVFEQKLETYFRELTKLKELKMSRKLKDLIKEDDTQLDLSAGEDDGMDDAGGEDVDAGADDGGGSGELTLKLTGLGDVDIDNVGVDLVASEDEPDDGDDFGSDDAGDDGDLGDLDLGGEGGDESGEQMESKRLSDDTVVEIDEGMLRREIARMKKIREASESRPDNGGQGVDGAAMDDFGGGHDDGEAFLDGEVTTAQNESDEIEEGEDLDESDDAMDEADDEGDMPPVAEVQNRRKADEHGVSANSDMQSVAYEGLQRRASFEKRLQESAKKKAAALKKEAARSKGAKRASIVKEYKNVAERFNASLARSKKITERITKVKALIESRSNSVSKPAESKAVKGLRNQLAESNLFNQKLVYCNKILQSESLSKRQKAQCIDRLDEAKTLREAKLVYESLVKALSSKPLREGRSGSQILGSSSRATRPASTQTTINEGFETDRWATLAGITKK